MNCVQFAVLRRGESCNIWIHIQIFQVWGRRNSFNYTFDYDTYPCGGIKTSETGEITSPDFPNKPSTSIECSWVLNLPKNHQINLTFATLDLGDDCDKSFIEIFNGPSSRSPRIGIFCKNNMFKFGSSNSSSVISERNTLVVNYHFSADNEGKGFNLTWKPVINGE